MKEAWGILINSIPILLMVALIPFVGDDYSLTGLYVVIIVASLFIKREKNDVLIFTLGFIVMIFFEAIFISTGVETFIRNSLFGLMPLWLPFLWGYGFIAIKRSVKILDN